MTEIEIVLITGLTIKIYALLTPTAVLSAFIAYASDLPIAERRRIAIKTGIAIYVIGQLLLVFGHSLFSLFGFTLDAFRIGVGLLLFLSAISLMNDDGSPPKVGEGADISVVPLAIPLGMGPATIGVLMVMGASASSFRDSLIISFCLLLASLGMTAILLAAGPVKRILRRTGLLVMAKLTALLVSAIAAQVIFTGIKGFLKQ